MTESGMLLRRQDPADARRVFIELSPKNSAKIDDFIVAVSTRSAPII
jgi:DNA-binding MarR family transcriptional regulator